MRGKFLKVAVAATATAMLATACSGGDDAAEETGKSGGELRVYASEPAFLLPSAADDEPSIYVIRQLYRGLVKYNAETAAVENDLAESIDSDDQKLWTIKLKSGYTFDNGEPVNADSFIRSWNYAAYGPNAQNNSYFMKRIAGIKDVSSVDPDGDGPQKAPEPKAKELSGLKKVDDLTFTVELDKPFSGFPTTVGYSGFFPMAQACVDAADQCNEKPIGNGPYKMEGTWQHNVGITLARSDTWKGEPGKPDKINYRIFADVDAGYAAFQAGELDVMYTLPPARYKEAKQQYGDRLYEQPGDSFTYVGLPLYNENFKDKRVRQALSLAIDRQSIIDAVFDGRFTPAAGFVAPTFEGARDDICQYCKKDVEKAKQLLAEAGGWKGGKLTLWANAGAGHDQWLQAVGDQIKAALGIDYELKVNLQFPEYLETADSRKFTGPFRLGWGPDYPFMETYLAPLYSTGADSNNSTYANPAFDALMTEGDAANSIQEAIPAYQKAEDLLVEDLPVIPMWFSKVAAVYGENVDNFVWNAVSDADYGQTSLKQ
ncbi:peptide/nickel transport system substrate-binding protein [Micromonospora nigra]|uniref:Peptide/nickel transport system substrate-binding protein n=1 Tax=Micromonospora nigra TaxID=145857 RepID=A0A1C6RR46_9ACTN|nr:ABC transporter substrate-binding protein [Micromonospora nigra]SCL19499.1 peptide/nickel transport system substrate-binding protein [Micromonospora nigra]